MATRNPRRAQKPRPFRWTRAWLSRLPDDGNRYEVLDGALLVTPQARPGHQVVAARLVVLMSPHCESHELGTVVGPGAVVWKQNELQPDVQVIPRMNVSSTADDWTELPLPMLVVEVLSPGSERYDLNRKRTAYLGLGIPEYWVVDIDKRCVLVFRPGSDDPRTATETLEWQPAVGVPPLVVDVRALVGS